MKEAEHDSTVLALGPERAHEVRKGQLRLPLVPRNLLARAARVEGSLYNSSQGMNKSRLKTEITVCQSVHLNIASRVHNKADRGIWTKGTVRIVRGWIDLHGSAFGGPHWLNLTNNASGHFRGHVHTPILSHVPPKHP